jgi:uncharacterized protein (TIGR02117 family)
MRHVILILCALRLFIADSAGDPIWLVSNGFHTSIAVRRADVPRVFSALSDDTQAEHLLIGWGAAIYYTARKITPVLFCRATCFPTASALHIVPVRGPLARRFPHSDILRFDVSREQMAELSRFLSDAVRRYPSGKPVVLGPGYFPRSHFYAGRHIFWFPVTCNIWSARALRRAGVPVNAATSVTAASLIRQALRYGRREQWRRRPVDKF